MKKRTRLILIGVGIVAASVGAAHWYYGDRGRFTTEPEFTNLGRNASGNQLTSSYDPESILTFGDDYRYLGGQKFILYGVADTEQHFYVETTEDGTLESLYWIQYEAYLPGKPYTYDYDDSPLRVAFGNAEFFVDTAVFEFDPNVERRRGTDGAAARAFLAQHGYTYPRHNAYARLVYLTDESRQKELMIIFIDNLESYGYTTGELEDGGDKAGEYPAMEQAMLRNIEESLAVEITELGSGLIRTP